MEGKFHKLIPGHDDENLKINRTWMEWKEKAADKLENGEEYYQKGNTVWSSVAKSSKKSWWYNLLELI